MRLIMELANDPSIQHRTPTALKNNQGSSQDSALGQGWVQDLGSIMPQATKHPKQAGRTPGALTSWEGWPFQNNNNNNKNREKEEKMQPWHVETVLPVCVGLYWTPGSFQLEPRNADGVWSLSASLPWREEAFGMMG